MMSKTDASEHLIELVRDNDDIANHAMLAVGSCVRSSSVPSTVKVNVPLDEPVTA